MSASAGDEVYFHHRGVPKSGKVLCAGKHGCTVVDEAKVEHKLKHEHIAGFKKRAPQRYTVLEEGEDGLIVKDASGKRRFIAIPPEAKADQLVLDKPKKGTSP